MSREVIISGIKKKKKKNQEKEKKYNVIGAMHAVLRPLLLDRCTYTRVTMRYVALSLYDSDSPSPIDKERREGETLTSSTWRRDFTLRWLRSKLRPGGTNLTSRKTRREIRETRREYTYIVGRLFETTLVISSNNSYTTICYTLGHWAKSINFCGPKRLRESFFSRRQRERERCPNFKERT